MGFSRSGPTQARHDGPVDVRHDGYRPDRGVRTSLVNGRCGLGGGKSASERGRRFPRALPRSRGPRLVLHGFYAPAGHHRRIARDEYLPADVEARDRTRPPRGLPHVFVDEQDSVRADDPRDRRARCSRGADHVGRCGRHESHGRGCKWARAYRLHAGTSRVRGNLPRDSLLLRL